MSRSVARSELLLGAGAVVLATALVGTAATAARAERLSPYDVSDPAVHAAHPPSKIHRIAAGAAITPATQHSSTEDSQLESALANRLSRATARRYAIVVHVAGKGEVANIGGYLSMMPASTQKLFTTLPLLLAQPDRTLLTTVSAGAAPQAGVVHGNLVVRASGDPSFTRPDIASLARQVRAKGVHRVTGRLVLDIGNLSLQTRRDGWKWDMVPSDIGPLSPLPIRADQLRHDWWYLSHPTYGNLHILRTMFAAHGIHIAGKNVIVRTSHPSVLLATHSSPTMARLVRHTLRWSDNFWAETLLNVEGGRPAVKHVATQAGVSGTTYATDGSGLSYLDRETVIGETALLRYATDSPAADAFLASLPVACRSGTLRHEFCGTVAEGKVWAKTGTLSHAKALAGYTTDARGRLVTFAILCNAVRNTDSASHAMQRAVIVLRNYSR